MSMSTESLSASLLDYLRTATGTPAVAYRQPLNPLPGGYDTAVYELALNSAPSNFQGSLVLRLFPDPGDAHRAETETIVQNTLADQGYPTARVLLVCTDADALGRPFMLMEKLPGAPLLTLEEPAASRLMGETHARLHELDAGHLRQMLSAGNVRGHLLDDTLAQMTQLKSAAPWLAAAVGWLVAQRPREAALAVCHGDFHKLNLLVRDGELAGVLDWSTFALMEPAYDVACTLISFTIVARHLTDDGEYEPVDLDQVVADYLAAYQGVRNLDTANLDYYRVLRSVSMMMLAARGFRLFQHPALHRDLARLVETVTGVRVGRP